MKFLAIVFATAVAFCSRIILDTIESQVKRYASVADFLDDLKNTASDLVDYASKIQTLFCPEQPVCGTGDLPQTGDTLKTSSSELFIGNVTMKLEDFHSFVGVCCLPCSCSDSCWEDDNCCPTKQLIYNNSNMGPVSRKCVAATTRSYDVRPDLSKYHVDHMYLMTTDCVQNITNLTILEHCRNPDTSIYGDTVPVTSLTTGKIYWNRACATCNNDDGDVMEWSAHVMLKQFIQYSTFAVFAETFEKLFALLRLPRHAEIIYTPPIPMDDSRCISRGFFIDSYCEIPATELGSSATHWTQELCRHTYSPVKLVSEQPDVGLEFELNIFCFICQSKLQFTDQKDCSPQGLRKAANGYITALLNYKREPNKLDQMKSDTHHAKNNCGCAAIYDPYLEACRSLYCSSGEIQIGCTCMQPLQNLSGMPVLLRIKVTIETEQDKNLTISQLMKLKKALLQTLKTTAVHVSSDHVTIFHYSNATRSYYVFIVILHSAPGHDTKQTLKPFKKYLDTNDFLEFATGKIAFSARLTSTVMVWTEKPTDGTWTFKASEMEQPMNELAPVYTEDVKYEFQRGYYQTFSRLLYCRQLQLNESEFFETSGLITVNVTIPMFSISDFYKLSKSEVRVCVDDYLNTPDEMKTSGKDISENLYWLLILVNVTIMIII